MGGAGAPPNSIGTNGCNTTLTICGTTYTAFGGGLWRIAAAKKKLSISNFPILNLNGTLSESKFVFRFN